ncbi:MAG: hypothetical protein CVU56_22825, partial [Deltaproteobacteria bacterium HGW-Deltaproteobacteria-14]
MDPMSSADPLNPEQRAAATHEGGPALVLAGPGTGKTTTLVARFAVLVSRGVPPDRILATTFTREAARQMNERVRRQVDVGAARLSIGTFHARCLEWLRQEARAFGLAGPVDLLDETGQFDLLRDLGFARSFDLDGLRDRIGRFKDELLTPAQALDAARRRRARPKSGSSGDDEEVAIARAYGAYQQALSERGRTDFGDLIGAVVRGLQRDSALRSRVAGRYDHLLVDEYQDINRAQHELIGALGAGHRNVWAVGDDDQAIYGWRGSDVRYLTGFTTDWPGARVVRLRQSYRSHPAIVSAAAALIAPNRGRLDKPLHPVSGGRTQVAVVQARSAGDEAAWIARSVRTLLDKAEPTPPKAVAVLVRTGAQMVHFEGALSSVGVDYELRGGRSFWRLPEVRNLEDGLRVVFGLPAGGNREVPDWLREVVTSRAGSSANGGLKAAARAVAAVVAERAPRGMKAERLAQWHAAAAEAARVAATFAAPEAFLRHAEDQRRGGRRVAADDRVVVSTIHQAKGLEWDAVFVAGFEAGLLPFMLPEDVASAWVDAPGAARLESE